MYFINTYRWDFATVAAMAAPRPCLLGNSDADDIFPVASYRRLYDNARRIYDLYGAGEKFQLLETKGPHKDTPELRLGAYAWMNRWLKDDRNPVSEPERPRLKPQQFKVFDRMPEDAINATVHELFIKPARIELPRVPAVVREWWPAKQRELLDQVRQQCFRGWPEKSAPLQPMLAADIVHDGLRLRAYDFQSEPEIELRLWLLTAAKTEKPTLTVLTAVDETGWRDWLAKLGPEFAAALQVASPPPLDEQKFTLNKRVLEREKWAFATIAPRGIGPTRWAPITPAKDGDDVHIRRRFALLGQTLDGQRVWDVRRGVELLRRVPDLQGLPLWLQGKGEMAGIVLYAGLFEPDVVRFDLWHPPPSHQTGPIFLNIRRVLDMPQAMALAFPRQVRLYVRNEVEARSWDWPLELQRALGQEHLKLRTVGD
jgi:hypothetical protein